LGNVFESRNAFPETSRAFWYARNSLKLLYEVILKHPQLKGDFRQLVANAATCHNVVLAWAWNQKTKRLRKACE
jgi:hypothetical protein